MSETKTEYKPETGTPKNGQQPATLMCEVDRVAVQITVAVKRDGRKIAEQPFQATTLFHPFDLEAALKTAVSEAQKAWDRHADL